MDQPIDDLARAKTALETALLTTSEPLPVSELCKLFEGEIGPDLAEAEAGAFRSREHAVPQVPEKRAAVRLQPSREGAPFRAGSRAKPDEGAPAKHVPRRRAPSLPLRLPAGDREPFRSGKNVRADDVREKIPGWLCWRSR